MFKLLNELKRYQLKQWGHLLCHLWVVLIVGAWIQLIQCDFHTITLFWNTRSLMTSETEFKKCKVWHFALGFPPLCNILFLVNNAYKYFKIARYTLTANNWLQELSWLDSVSLLVPFGDMGFHQHWTSSFQSLNRSFSPYFLSQNCCALTTSEPEYLQISRADLEGLQWGTGSVSVPLVLSFMLKVGYKSLERWRKRVHWLA